MAQMSNLPMDVAEEVLCRIPLTSLRNIRSTCTKWKTLSKAGHFLRKSLDQIQAAARKEFMVVMMLDYRVNLMGFNLHNKDKVESCISHQGKLINLGDNSDEIDVCQVFHCDGLLLCISKDNPRIVVWNPYSGQTRFIDSPHNLYGQDWDLYALGFDRSTKSHKILRIVDTPEPLFLEIKIYDFKSDSWRVLDNGLLLDNYIRSESRGVSLGGNNYWFAKERHVKRGFLICFDFESETFGPRLPLPFEPQYEDTVTLSSVREEQLAVLFQEWDTLLMEIWVTTKIQPNAVSWNTKVFLSVNMRPLTCFSFQFLHPAASFFIDEEKKVVVVFDKDKEKENRRNVAYIVGVDGTLKEADLGGRSEIQRCYPLVCSYAPSLVEF